MREQSKNGYQAAARVAEDADSGETSTEEGVCRAAIEGGEDASPDSVEEARDHATLDHAIGERLGQSCAVYLRRTRGIVHTTEWYEAVVDSPGQEPRLLARSPSLTHWRFFESDRERQIKADTLEGLLNVLVGYGWELLPGLPGALPRLRHNIIADGAGGVAGESSRHDEDAWLPHPLETEPSTRTETAMAAPMPEPGGEWTSMNESEESRGAAQDADAAGFALAAYAPPYRPESDANLLQHVQQEAQQALGALEAQLEQFATNLLRQREALQARDAALDARERRITEQLLAAQREAETLIEQARDLEGRAMQRESALQAREQQLQTATAWLADYTKRVANAVDAINQRLDETADQTAGPDRESSASAP